MKVCVECFKDPHIKRYISQLGSEDKCDVCRKKSIVVELAVIESIFYRILDIYGRNDNGKSLYDSIQSDLKLFSHGENTADKILQEVYRQDEWEKINKHRYTLKSAPSLEKEWFEFTESLKHGNRFFTETIFKEYLENAFKLFSHETSELRYQINSNTTLYRGRINKPGKRYYANNLYAPAKEITPGGRANPQWIPYLYLADDEYTAIAEIRPQIGQTISIGCFKVNDPITILRFKLLDLMDIIISYETAQIEDIDVLSIREFFSLISRKLSEPIDPSISAMGYIPTQYVCEFFKYREMLGIAYESAMTARTNIALFDQTKVHCYTSKCYNITDVKYEYTRITKC